MTLSIALQEQIALLRRNKVPFKRIALELGIGTNELSRHLNSLSHRSQNSKLRHDDPGELDMADLDRKCEADAANRLWGERMLFARWDRTRRDGEG